MVRLQSVWLCFGWRGIRPIRFEYSIRDSIRTKKADSQVPTEQVYNNQRI